MADINNVILVGRLTRDVELSYTPNNNTALAKFSIAVNEFKGKGEEEVNYFDIVVWGKIAEISNKYLSKGKQVVINGRLKQERFQDKQGQNRSMVKIIAQNIQFIGNKSERGGNNENNQSQNSDFSDIDFGNTQPDYIPF